MQPFSDETMKTRIAIIFTLLLSFVCMKAYADDYYARQAKQYTKEAEYYQKKQMAIAERLNITSKRRSAISEKRLIIPEREMLTGQRIIIAVPTELWMIIKRKCAMPPMLTTRRLTIFAKQPMRCASDEFLVTLNPNNQHI